jgi:transcriptional regulator with XRE-family HTH domain
VYDDVQMKIGLAIRTERLRLGYSQEMFAEAAGIDRARYGRIERGELNFTLKTLFAVASHLKIPPAELLKDITVSDCIASSAKG